MISKITQKYYREIILIAILAIVFWFTRLIHLTEMPIFTDEAIYLRWAQIAKNDASWRFISLTDGKQPLLVWLAMIFMKFVADPVIAGRLVSTFAGFATMIGMGFLGYELFQSRRVGFFSASLYLISPFSLIYDRMALMDALVGTFAIWSLYLAIILIKNLRLDVALILGMALGGGVLTKTSGFLNIYLLPFTLLVFKWEQRNKKRISNLIRWLLLISLAVLLSQVFYSVLRLSPWFHMISQKDATFIYPFGEWLGHPFNFFLGNLRGLFDWLKTYLTWPIIILALGPFLIFDKKFREKLILSIYFAAPFLALALFGKVLYPRFIFFMSLPLFILVAVTLAKMSALVKNKLLFLIVLLIFFGQVLFIDWQILFNLYQAPIPASDRGQYLNNWPAGGGVKEAVSFFQKEAQNNKIAIFTDGTFGLMPYSLELYLVDDPNVQLKGIWPLENITEEIVETAREKPTFLVTNQIQDIPASWPLRLLSEYPKGESNVFLRIFAIDLQKVKTK